MTLHARLEAAILARQERAQAAGARGGEWFATFYSPMDEWRVRDRPTAGQIVEVIADEDCAEQVSEHIAAEDPAFVLRQCARDLKVLERHGRFEQKDWSRERGIFTAPACTYCELTSNDGDGLSRDWPCADLLDLADAYAIAIEEDTDHDG